MAKSYSAGEVAEQEALVKRIRLELKELGKALEDEFHMLTNADWLALRTSLRTEEARLGRMRHPNRASKYASRYRVKKQGGVVEELSKEISDLFEGKCAYCGVNDAEVTDHITPISSGGSTIDGNVLPACSSCNQMKGTKGVYEFLSWLEAKDARLQEEITQRRLARLKLSEYLTNLAACPTARLE